MSVAAAPWRAAISVHSRPRSARTPLDLATSVVPYLGLLLATVFALHVSALLAFALAPLTAGFLLRTFIVFHDCAHGSARSRRGRLGYRLFRNPIVMFGLGPMLSWSCRDWSERASVLACDAR